MSDDWAWRLLCVGDGEQVGNMTQTSDSHAETAMTVTSEVDARGLRCPMPLLKAKQALRDLQPGEIVRVLATDAGSLRDFRAFAELSGHRLLEAKEEQGVYYYWLQKNR